MNKKLPAHSTDDTSPSLIERLRKKDALGWTRMDALYRPLIYFWCERSQLNAHDAEDLTQEVLAIVASKIESFEHGHEHNTFRGWLRVITRNQICQHLRKKKGLPQTLDGSAALSQIGNAPIAEDDHDAETEKNEKRLLFDRCLEMIQSEFEPTTWQAFMQTAMHTRATADVAEDLGISKGAVRTARYRVLRRLRQEFGEVLE